MPLHEQVLLRIDAVLYTCSFVHRGRKEHYLSNVKEQYGYQVNGHVYNDKFIPR